MDLAVVTTPTKTWTGERVEALTELVRQRIPYPEISERLQISLGAICGKVYRLGIGHGGEMERRRQVTIAPPTGEYADVLRRQAFEASYRTRYVTLEDLEAHHCRFVLGEPNEQRYCGATRVPGLSYCDEHRRRCVLTEADLAAKRARSQLRIIDGPKANDPGPARSSVRSGGCLPAEGAAIPA